jgi:hypothetical protein
VDVSTSDPHTPILPKDASADVAPEAEDDEGDVYLHDSVEAQELYDRAVREAGGGDEQRAIFHFLRAAKLAESAREWYLAALALRAAGDVFRTKEPPYDLQRALHMYLRAAAAFEACGHFDDAREMAYLISYLRMRKGGELGVSAGKRAELFLFWAVAGFGLCPRRVLGTAVATILGFALLYWGAGGVITQTGDPIRGFLDALYFSGVTFSTVGYGDFVPTPALRLFAMAEALIGAFTIGLFVVVLANRLRR